MFDNLMLKALAKQVRHLDKEGSAVATEAWLEGARKWVKPAPIEIVVITYVESCTRIRRVPEQKLSLHVCGDRIIIDAPARKQEAAELIGGPQRDDVFVKRHPRRVIARQFLFREIERGFQGGCRLESYAAIKVPEVAGSRVLWRTANWR